MLIRVEACFENGVLRPLQPLPLEEHEQVRITVEAERSWAERTAGLVRWTGDVESLDRLTMDAELDPQEGP